MRKNYQKQYPITVEEEQSRYRNLEERYQRKKSELIGEDDEVERNIRETNESIKRIESTIAKNIRDISNEEREIEMFERANSKESGIEKKLQRTKSNQLKIKLEESKKIFYNIEEKYRKDLDLIEQKLKRDINSFVDSSLIELKVGLLKRMNIQEDIRSLLLTWPKQTITYLLNETLNNTKKRGDALRQGLIKIGMTEDEFFIENGEILSINHNKCNMTSFY